MRSVLYLIILSCFVCLSRPKDAGKLNLLHRAIDALSRAVDYLSDEMSNFNIDAAFCLHLAEEQLQVFTISNPDIFKVLGNDMRNKIISIQQKANDTVFKSRQYLELTDLKFKALGDLLYPSKVIPLYPSKNSNARLIENPLPCELTPFLGPQSDRCYKEIIGSESEEAQACDISEKCLWFNLRPKQKDYSITHQVLYFQLLESHDCLQYLPQLDSEKLKNIRDYLCANVLRDAEYIADNNFPPNQEDMFMEQIGICGFYGYSDFYKPEWLEAIIEWQRPKGCYTVKERYHCIEYSKTFRKSRVKRDEKILSDGCYSHATAVSVLALTASIRFCAESVASNYLPESLQTNNY